MIFPNAKDARNFSRSYITIHNEIRDIETIILSRIESGSFSASVDTTHMTAYSVGGDAEQYWKVWQGIITNDVLKEQMELVISYFNGLGYSISRKTNILTGMSFTWEILW